MAKTPTVNVQVLAQGFSQFTKQFNKLLTDVPKINAGFKSMGSAANQAATNMSKMNISSNALLQRIQAVNAGMRSFNTALAASTAQLQQIPAAQNPTVQNTRKMANNVSSMTTNFRLWPTLFKPFTSAFSGVLGLVGAGLSISGMMNFMQNMVNLQMRAGGLGMTFGQYKGFVSGATAAGYFADPASVAGNLGTARYNILSPQFRAFSNLFGRGAINQLKGDPADAAVNYLTRLKSRIGGRPEQDWLPLAQTYGATDIFDPGTIIRFLSGQLKPDEMREKLKKQEEAAKIPDETLKALQELNTNITLLKNSIMTDLANAIAKLSGPIDEWLKKVTATPSPAATGIGSAAGALVGARLGAKVPGMFKLPAVLIGGILGGIVGEEGMEKLESLDWFKELLGIKGAKAAATDKTGALGPLRERAAEFSRRKAISEENNKELFIRRSHYFSGPVDKQTQDQIDSTNKLTATINNLIIQFQTMFGFGGGASGGGGGGGWSGHGAPPMIRSRGRLPGGVALGGGKTPGKWWTPERMQYAVNKLMKEGGLSEVGAAGLVARWAGIEASGGPESHNWSPGRGGPGHFGIGQWEVARGGLQVWHAGFDAQLAHAIQEGKTTELGAWRRLQTAKTPGEAAVGASMFERAEHYNPATGTDDWTTRTPVDAVLKAIHKAKPPDVVDKKTTGDAVRKSAPGRFHIHDPNPDPLTSHEYPAPGEKSGPLSMGRRRQFMPLDLAQWVAPDRRPSVSIHNMMGSNAFIVSSTLAT